MARRGNEVPFVSIVMPCYNEGSHIERCLRGVVSQAYPGDRLEVLVGDGRSTDDTRDKIAALQQEDERIRLVDNPDRHQAGALNRCLREARGELVVRMDAHCDYAPDYVQRSVEALMRTGADVVGGPQRLAAISSFQKASAAALRSPLGMGGARFRTETYEGFVDTVFLGSFRRSVFETVGLYDEKAVPNEDSDLNQRVVEGGGRIYLDPAIRVAYHPRESFRALARQYFHYGRGRARTMLKHRGLLTLRPVVPFLGLLGLLATLAASVYDPRALAVLGLYALVIGFETMRASRGLPPGTVLRIPPIFPTMHLAHAIGFACGLARYSVRPDWEEPAPRLPRRPGAAPSGG